MKFFMILISFIFTVACYASPPPVPVPQFQTDELQYILQPQVQTAQVYVFENIQPVLNVALRQCSGSFETIELNNLVAEEVTAVKLPNKALIDNSYLGIANLNKPPSDNRMNATNPIDKQNSNYGYPFTGDKC